MDNTKQELLVNDELFQELLRIYKKPNMIINEKDLIYLHHHIAGFTTGRYFCQEKNNIVHSFDIFNIDNISFDDFVKDSLKIAQNTTRSLYDVIIFYCNSRECAFDKFFELYDEYLFKIFNIHFFAK